MKRVNFRFKTRGISGLDEKVVVDNSLLSEYCNICGHQVSVYGPRSANGL